MKEAAVPVATPAAAVAVAKEEKLAIVPAATSEFDETLCKAAKKGTSREVEALLAKGAIVKAVVKYGPYAGFTLLHYAAQGGHSAIVDTLLAKGADVKAVDEEGRTSALGGGCGHTAIVDTLLAHGADAKSAVSDGTYAGWTALHKAAEFGHAAIVDTLLAHGADAKAVDQFDGTTPLHYAAENGHTAIVDALLKAGADGTAKNKFGKSPADLALEKRYLMIVAKCDPAFAKAEGEKLREAFKGAKRVSVLSSALQ